MLTPDWPEIAGSRVRAACTTRDGGVSTGAYASLNLGDHVGDAPAAVLTNRARLAQAIGARPVYLQQVHGIKAVVLGAATPDGTVADACATALPGVACTIMVADCLPVLLAAHDGSAVAAAHAGWRGLAGGAIESAHATLRELTGPRDVGISAWLGPCIGPDAFEVGDEVRAAFLAAQPAAQRHFRPHPQAQARAAGKWFADLAGLARDRLAALGVVAVHGNDGTRAWCTHADASRFFSHRRDRVSGRFAACVWIDGP